MYLVHFFCYTNNVLKEGANMSGHSKWATIHRKKGELDAQRGKVFQKIAKEIYIAAKGTNGDPDSNPSLRAVIEKARSNNELSLIEVKCSIGAREDLGRPTTTALENKENFMDYLKNI